MVLVTIGLASSEGGMDGSGDAVSDQSADEREKWDPSCHRLYLRYLGRNSCASSLFAIAVFFSVAKSFAFFASVFEAAVICAVPASVDRVETVAYFIFVCFTGGSL